MTAPLSHRNLSSARARFAYAETVHWPDRWRPEATARVQGLPIQMRTQGLLVTLAMLTGGGDDGQKAFKGVDDTLARTLTTWLLVEAPHRPLGRAGAKAQPFPADLLDILTKAPRADYAAAQREAILLLDQIKIFAKALPRTRT
ncbi:type III-B CRISPR module-associated protein Cmr5 [Roseospira navarrensis]|uniref:CRISPR type III-B/RAMP module-associated protein Cmr5 n=1 Tax=Roseospira navarrensis TaxID=140058 RepID=A0A7X2D452_9PROT|nr:type III-B CRISPR module-associated protein Cmr5 [Roseospira navarrensis]MQX37568.1 hypothetical protein [Roseospira navarrensis]